ESERIPKIRNTAKIAIARPPVQSGSFNWRSCPIVAISTNQFTGFAHPEGTEGMRLERKSAPAALGPNTIIRNIAACIQDAMLRSLDGDNRRSSTPMNAQIRRAANMPNMYEANKCEAGKNHPASFR